MKHRATPDFWYYYRQLPIDIQELANRCYEFLWEDPKHSSLHFKKVDPFWSVRIGIYYRALAVKEDDNFVWFWIGSHPEYDRLLSGG
ncbi:MAG: hypothetical protein V7K40_20215 [Nostoc sp.]|uniref:ParE family toxin-like protein n=1 Tax=Nostoc sp. TaxID=1180 RepID=UPI002FFBE24C